MTLHIPFDNSYARLPENFYTRQNPAPVKGPHLVAFNSALAANLGITAGEPDEMAQVFAGNAIPDGAEP
ncbi:MAG: hypothetical protein AAFU69_04040, partial [Pseudomonadota bacterium]